MIELAEVVRKHGPEYLDKFGDRMPHSHKRALFAITACRTEEMGGHLEECDHHCGHFDYTYHSCKNGSCPKCHGADTNRWLTKREAELLPVPYFHLVFTLPAELREVVRRNQKALYAVLFQAAIAALSKLGLDRKYLGGQLGMVTVLHTCGPRNTIPTSTSLFRGAALTKTEYGGLPAGSSSCRSRHSHRSSGPSS